MEGPTSRRSLLAAAALTAAGVGSLVGGTTPAQAAGTANLVGSDPVWHLLRRATFGATPQLVAEVRTRGATAWLNEQLAPSGIDDSACDAYLARYPSLRMSVAQLRATYSAQWWETTNELVRATVARAVFSRRQLFEVMVEFWTNHFNIAVPVSELADKKPIDDRDVIRRYALGRFADLLKASATSPAMLRYLNNDTSSARTLNENYGRELLELHTVGVDAGYSQAEVVDSARILTGFGIASSGLFAYTPARHFVGPVRVLGFTHANSSASGGLGVGQQYLDYLAHHPSTAQHLATKLARRFVADDPPPALVSRLATIYLQNDTAIVPVLKALFSSPEFLSSFGQKTRRPLEDVIATLRALGAAPKSGNSYSFQQLYWVLQTLGQLPMAWGPPNGYPDDTASWMSASGTLFRWNTHLLLAQGWWQDAFTLPPLTSLLTRYPPDNGDLIDQLSARLLGIRLADQQRNALLTFLTSAGAGSVGVTLSKGMDILIALILDSPAWIQR